MVGIITGKGPGIENSSLSLLGSRGQLGGASVGQGAEQLFVNAATGNLVVTGTDEMLVGRGPDVAIARTYNSLGTVWDGDNDDRWRASVYRRLSGLPSDANYGMGTITRIDWDGSEATYAWDTNANAYVTTDGSGAYDSIAKMGGVWTWTDGDTQVTETYDHTQSGRIVSRKDPAGNTIGYTYTGSLITKVTTSDGEYTELSYTGTKLTELKTYVAGSSTQRVRTRYTYEDYVVNSVTLTRLKTVVTDLTPENTGDTSTYVITYGYNTANQLSSIEQDDNSRIEIDYDGSGRVVVLREAATGPDNAIVYRATSFDYSTPGTTRITDPIGQVTALSYDANNNLTRIVSPASGAGQPAQVTDFAYEADGDVASVARGGNTTAFGYDGHGNRVLDRDALGNTVTRVYGSRNELLAETRYLVPDADGAGSSPPGTPQVTRYVYDTLNHLRYVVSSEGRVTEFRYDGFGQQVSSIQYTAATYGGAALTDPTTLQSGTVDAGTVNAANYAAVNAWISGLADRSAAQRTDSWYDFRGNVTRTASYATLNGFGQGSDAPLNVNPGLNTTVTALGNGLFRITKTSGADSTWNADAHSVIRADGDFVLEVHPAQTTAYVDAGVSSAPGADAALASVRYGFRFDPGGTVRYSESNGTSVTQATLGVTYNAGDTERFWLVRTGGTIGYYKGATLDAAIAAGALRTVGGITTPMYFDSSVYALNASIDARFMTVTNGANTSVTPQADGFYHVAKTGVDGWNADARGSEAAAGDFVLQLRPSQADKYFIAGVSASPGTDSSKENVTYGFRFNDNGTVRRGDGGGDLGLIGGTINYAAGDNFWLVRTGTTLSYYKGRTLEEARAAPVLYTVSNVTGTLYFDSSLFSAGVALDIAFTPRPAIVNGTNSVVSALADGLYHVAKSGGSDGWNADARGAEAAMGDFVLQLRPSQSDRHFIAGVSANPGADAANTGVTYGFRFYNDGTVRRGDGGGNVHFSPVVTYAAGDNFWLVRTGTTLSYYQGATLAAATAAGAIGTTANVTGTLYFDSSLFSYTSASARAEFDVGFAPAAPATFTDVTRTDYVYDAAGRLLSRAVSGKGVETFAYDGLGRLVSSVDATGTTTATSFAFQGETSTTTVTLASGLVRTSTWNRAGQLVDYTESAASNALSTVRYNYDGLGRLRIVTTLATPTTAIGDAANARSFLFYDALGRVIGTVDADGSAVETRYDADGNVTSTTGYATRLTSTQIASLFYTGAGNPTAVTFDAIRPAASADDRWSWQVHDKAGRLVQSIDGDGSVTAYAYDGASQLTGTTRYATRLTSTVLANLKAVATDRWGNSANGTAWTTEGSSTVTAELVNGVPMTIDGASAYRVTVNTTGAAGFVRPNSGMSVQAGDTVTMTFWVRAGSDETTTLEALNLKGSSSNYGAVGETSAAILSGPGTINGTTGQRSITGLSKTLWTLVTITRTFAQAETMTASIYAGYASANAEAGDYILVANPTLLVAPASGLVTLYPDTNNDRATRLFYDNDGRLEGTLDAEGYLTEVIYDAAGRKVRTIAYADAANTLTGDFGTVKASVTTDPAKDIRSWWLYDARGMLRATIDGEGTVTRFDYDPAGNLARQVTGQKLDVATLIATPPSFATLVTPAASEILQTVSWIRNLYGDVLTETHSLTGTVTTTTSYGYDALRRLVSTTTQYGGTDPRSWRQRYDVQGRLIGEVGPEGSATLGSNPTDAQLATACTQYGWTYNYNAIDQLVSKVGPTASGLKSLYYYNADGALAYEVNALGEVAEYKYNAFGDRSDTIVYAGRIGTGNLATMTGGAVTSAIVTIMTGVDNPALDSATHLDFNVDGQVKQSTDPLGNATLFAYNGFDELETSTAPLDTRTIVTDLRYDRRGLLEQHTVNPTTAGSPPTDKQIVTTYGYDAFGRAVTLTNAENEATTSEYDRDGRLVKATDAEGYTTSYTYDARDNLVAVSTLVLDNTDNNLDVYRVTRYVYDKAGRRIAVIDALGGVVTTSYDADGRVIATRAYKNKLSLTGMPLEVTESAFAAPTADATNDRITRFAYDEDGQLRFTVDAQMHVVEQSYDIAGNVVRTTSYDGTIGTDGTGAYSESWIAGQVASLASDPDNRISRAVYDRGQLAYAIDPAGLVTAYTYDTLGNVTRQTAYAKAYTATANPALADMTTWIASAPVVAEAANDRTSYAFYDTAGQLGFGIDALGYVTRYVHDKAGNLTQQLRFPAAHGSPGTATLATLQAAYPTYPTTTLVQAQVTRFVYDDAGRLEQTIDPTGSITHLALDRMGRITASTEAHGTTDAVTTSYTYDDLGRVETRTLDMGTDPDIVTSYTYDGLGNVVKINLAAAGSAGADSWFYFDKLGRQTVSRDAENHVTETSYTAFGEVASVTRRANKATNTASIWTLPAFTADTAKDATTSFEYDKLGQLTRTVDAEGKDERYELNVFGERTGLRNKLGSGLVKTDTDYAKYLTVYTYDTRGLLKTETLPYTITTKTSGGASISVVTSYSYDAFGNRTAMVEASGAAEARTTSYAYDKLGRLKQTTGATVEVVADDLTTSNQALVDKLYYDARGNVVEAIDAAGARTLAWYDAADRKVAELNPLGTLTEWTYDARGNLETVTVYATPATLPTHSEAASYTKPTATNPTDCRTTSYAYTNADGLRTSSVASVLTGEWNGTAYATTTGTVTTTSWYDAMGNVVRQQDGRLNSIYSWYDKLGRKTAQVDQEGYLTVWMRDAEGNATSETRYATRLSGTGYASAADRDALVALVTANSATDRTTIFEYDRVGNRTKEKRTGVASGTVDASGVLTTATVTATIEYQYNALGQVTKKIEANDDATTYAYDQAGRLTLETGQAFTDYQGTTVTPRTAYTYDGLGNLATSSVLGLDDGATTDDRITKYQYGAGGRLFKMTVASGSSDAFERRYGYDAAGRVVMESYVRTLAGGSTVNEAIVSRYDLAGRVTRQTNARLSGTWVYVDWNDDTYDATHFQYNAFGDMTGRGTTAASATTPAYQETFDYDKAGRLWKSNTGDGVLRFYIYDKAGNQTATLASAGADLSDRTKDNYTAAFAAADDKALTYTVYDKRGQATQTREPGRRLTSDTNVAAVLVTRGRDYNAFGEVVAETDPRGYDSSGAKISFTGGAGYTTTFTYNTMGRLVSKVSPQVSITSETGVVSNATPTENYSYDASGRLVAVTDANGNLSTRLLLAGTGHGESEALVTAEFRPVGGVYRTKYDVFGDARVLRNELYAYDAGTQTDNATSTDELRTYDKLGRLIQLDHRGRLLTDHYAYDGLGQRIKHWIAQSGSTIANIADYYETTDYDSQGRVTLTRTFGGDLTSYRYLSWGVSAPTLALGGADGRIKEVTNAGGVTMREATDHFGRVFAREDFGGNDTVFTYDKGGRLVSQAITPVGESTTTTTYDWLNTGLQAKVTTGTAVSTYAYDVAGNRIEEVRKVGTIVHQDADVTWDAMNRMRTFDDAGVADGAAVNIDYEYDARGNVRHMVSQYRLLDNQGNVITGGTPATQDYWYRYDGLNRFTVTKGMLVKLDASGNVATNGSGQYLVGELARGVSGATIDRYATGSEILYDLASRRIRATMTNRVEYYGEYSYIGYTEQREDYSYNADGYLTRTDIATGSETTDYALTAPYIRPGAAGAGLGRALTSYDAMGRVTVYAEYNAAGYNPANATTNLAYKRTVTYNTKSQVTQDVVTSYRPDGTLQATSDYYYTAVLEGGVWEGRTSGGSYMGGAVTRIDTSSTWNTYDDDEKAPETRMVYQYRWGDGAVVAKTSKDPNAETGETLYDTTYVRDAFGRLVRADIDADSDSNLERQVTLVNDAEGRVLQRDEWHDAGTTDPRELHYYFNGIRVGDISNNGTSNTDYAASITSHQAIPGTTGSFRDGGTSGAAYADFDQSYDAINGFNYESTASSYTVISGDTLTGIAQQVWGDASLWYMIAEANGLNGSEVLVAGQVLTIPNKVHNLHNNADTWRPYDPNEAMGDLSPTAPKKPRGNCGILGQILASVVAIAVAFVVSMIPYVGTFLAPIAANAASQAVLIATGDQEKFNWKAVGMAAVQSAVALTNGGGGGGFVNAKAQLIGKALGLQENFDWAAVAAAEVASMTSAVFGNNVIGQTAATIAAAGTRSLITGTSFGDNLIAVLPSVIASTIGSAFEDAISRSSSPFGQGAGEEGAFGHGDAYPSSEYSAIDDAADGGEIVVTGSRSFSDYGALDAQVQDMLGRWDMQFAALQAMLADTNGDGFVTAAESRRGGWNRALADMGAEEVARITENGGTVPDYSPQSKTENPRLLPEAFGVRKGYASSQDRIGFFIEQHAAGADMHNYLDKILFAGETGDFRGDYVNAVISQAKTQGRYLDIERTLYPEISAWAESDANWVGPRDALANYLSEGQRRADQMEAEFVQTMGSSLYQVGTVVSGPVGGADLLYRGLTGDLHWDDSLAALPVLGALGRFGGFVSKVGAAEAEAATVMRYSGRRTDVRAKFIDSPSAQGSTPGHAFASRRAAYEMALNPEVERVTMNAGYNRLLRLEPSTISPNVRPDAAALYYDGRIARTEIMSDGDLLAQDLISRNTALDSQLRGLGYRPLAPQAYRPTRR